MAEKMIPHNQAWALLKEVMGEAQANTLAHGGSLEIPSRCYPGRVYVLKKDSFSFREPWEKNVQHNLCLVAQAKDIPEVDMITARYMLARFDEQKLIATAHEGCNLVSVLTAMLKDLRIPRLLAEVLAWVASAFFLQLSTRGVVYFFQMVKEAGAANQAAVSLGNKLGSAVIVVGVAFLLVAMTAVAIGCIVSLSIHTYWRVMCLWRSLTPGSPRWQRKGGP